MSVAADMDEKCVKEKVDQPKTFEDLLKHVGEFGKYQKRLVIFFMIPTLIISPWYTLCTVFLASIPDHWCYVPEVANSHLPMNIQQELTRPKDNPSCSMYAINYTELLNSSNLTADETWPTQPCNQGWIYDTSYYDATAATKWNMVCSDRHFSSLVRSVVFFGNLVGTVVFGHFADKFGRKKTFFVLVALATLTDISSVLVPNFTAFFILRFLNGSTSSVFYVIAYIILLEMVGSQKRASMNGIGCSAWTLGICLLPFVAWVTHDWVKLSIVSSTCTFAIFLYWRFLPESPRWLFSEKRYEEASQILAKMSKTNGKTMHDDPEELMKQMSKLKDNIEKEDLSKKENYSAMDFVQHGQLRKRFCLLSICWTVNSMVYFGLQINVENLTGNQFLNFFLLSVVEFPSHAITWFAMEKYGRRWCTTGAFAITGIFCIIPVLFPHVPLVGIICSVLGKLGSSSSFMTIYQLAPELFPTPVRGIGMTLSSAFGNVASLSSPYIVYLAIFDKSIPFMIFSALNFMAVVCACFIPETLSKKLPQTLTDIETPNEKFFTCYRKQSSFSHSQNGSICVRHVQNPHITGKWENNCVFVDNKGPIPQTEPTSPHVESLHM